MIYNLIVSSNINLAGIEKWLKKRGFKVLTTENVSGIDDDLSAEYADKYPKLSQDWGEKIRDLSEEGTFLEIECQGVIPAALAVWEDLTGVFGKKEIILCQISKKNENLPLIMPSDLHPSLHSLH